MTYKYNPFWQQRIRETVRHALNVHPRLRKSHFCTVRDSMAFMYSLCYR
ncbi:hypothetical protein GAJ33_08170 [Escherichia coli]|nr:hypothetical protein [Escherichia coli]